MDIYRIVCHERTPQWVKTLWFQKLKDPDLQVDFDRWEVDARDEEDPKRIQLYVTWSFMNFKGEFGFQKKHKCHPNYLKRCCR